MKPIGLIGGLAPESTVDYYKEIISSFNSKNPLLNTSAIHCQNIIKYCIEK